MAYKKKTIRHLGPQARKFARMINELESTTRRLKNFMARLQDLELDSVALTNINKTIDQTFGPTKSGFPDLDNDPALQALLSKHIEPEGNYPFREIDAGEEQP
jgi:hypothetical protein